VLIPGLDAGSPGGRQEPSLEGLLEAPEDRDPIGGIVVAHPHPLYGGTMLQPVVHHTARACRRRGFTSLRFNFRGVGASEGSYAGWDERKDVRAALRFLRERMGPVPIVLAGYSFGSLMSALAVIEGERPAGLALIAFVTRWDEFQPNFFARLGEYTGPVLAICGEQDEIAPAENVENFLTRMGVRPEMRVVEGVDHFFLGHQEEVGEAVATFALDVSRQGQRHTLRG
jgi:alpha/beta superfamily hydrolase